MIRLKKAYIEITNKCNLSCDFCPGTTRTPGFMSIADFSSAIKRLKGYTEYLYLHVMGEPLLHPELSKLLEICNLYGFKVNITTNGLLIEKKSEDILGNQSVRQVNFSLHSQESIKDEAFLRKYLEDVFAFTDSALAKENIYISFRLWNLTSDAAEQYNTYVIQQLENHYSPDFSITEELGRQNRIKLLDRLYVNGAEVFHWPSLGAQDAGESGFCLGLRDQVAILVDGTVVPCCLDSNGVISLGNIFVQEFEHIFNSERAKALYEGFSKRRAEEELCRKCGYRHRFSK